jgi:streptomycin 3"-adenylyltransferase
MGCYNPLSSDIDLLAVVEHRLTIQDKKAIIDYLLAVDSGSQAGSPEISIVTAESLKKLAYPPPFELYYDHAWRDCFKIGVVDLAEQRDDADLPMHFLAVRERGVCLHGAPVKDVFPEMPREIFLASSANDLKWISEKFDTLSPAYIVLNPCRALSFLIEGVFMSKKEGGEWGLHHLPQEFTGLIGRALALYAGADDSVKFETGELKEFLEYATREYERLFKK